MARHVLTKRQGLFATGRTRFARRSLNPGPHHPLGDYGRAGYIPEHSRHVFSQYDLYENYRYISFRCPTDIISMVLARSSTV